jgi:response regulator RpfG family c-di-GMP phosphodiesterase
MNTDQNGGYYKAHATRSSRRARWDRYTTLRFKLRDNCFSLLESESNRTAIFSACLNELQEQQTILVIEDVHWADEATLDLLKYLGRRIRQTISLMILTYRDDEIGVEHPLRILLGDLASSPALHRVPVHLFQKMQCMNWQRTGMLIRSNFIV